MKAGKKGFIGILVYITFCMAPALSVYAVDVEREQGEALGIGGVESALPEEAGELMGDLSAADISGAETVLQRISDSIGDKLGSILKRGLRSSAIILIIVLLSAVARTVYDSGGGQDFVHLGSALAVGAVAVGDVGAFIGLGSSTLAQLSDFSKILLPSLSAAAAATGAITSASAKYAATALFMDVLITISGSLVMPLVYAYIAATIANSAMGGDALSGAADILKWLCKTLLTVLVLIFTAYLGLTGVISGSADAVTTRVTKTAITSLLPVVGSIISDAASAVISGAAVLRNAVGIFGMLAVICTCLTPFLTLGVHYLLYKAVSGVTGAVADKRLSGMVSGIGSAFGIVLALVGTGAIMLFFSIISCMKAVGAA